MSLWLCSEHGLYGGDVFCPKCGGTGSVVTLALCGAPASVDTLPKGQDAKQGLAGTEGSAVAESETPIPHSSSDVGE